MKKWLPENNLNSRSRYLSCPLPIVAITGGIGTGKSTFCDLLEENHYSVLRADQIVKQVYQLEEVKLEIKTNFPELFSNDHLDFTRLRSLFFNDKEVKKFIETLIYKNMPKIFHDLLKQSSFDRSEIIFYEIPLLFEKGYEDKFDFIICISLSQEEQIKRVKHRDYKNNKVSSDDEINKILMAQLPLEKKEHGSHLVIFNKGSECLKEGLHLFENKFLSLIKNT